MSGVWHNSLEFLDERVDARDAHADRLGQRGLAREAQVVVRKR